ncbi:MAG TPA: hypothetical protein VIV60_31700 [Polyangiaceae bacterium]
MGPSAALLSSKEKLEARPRIAERSFHFNPTRKVLVSMIRVKSATGFSLLILGTIELVGCDTGSGIAAGSGGVNTNGGSAVQRGGSTSNASQQGGNTNSAAQQGGSTTSASQQGGSSSVGGTSSQSSDALLMDSSGRVEKSSNRFNIQGSWYWYADFSDGHAGLTTLTGAENETAPYLDGKGMCIVGTTPGGAKDDYVTWGAGIGLNLNQGTEDDGGTTPQRLNPAPKCFSITLSADSSAPGGILGKLLESNPMPGTTADANLPQEAPSVALKAGQTTDVCVSNVTQPSWCTASSHKPGDCADPKNLEPGIASIQIQALAGSSGGNINVCVVSIVPKD